MASAIESLVFFVPNLKAECFIGIRSEFAMVVC